MNQSNPQANTQEQFSDDDCNYCDSCQREISSYQSTTADGFCQECLDEQPSEDL